MTDSILTSIKELIGPREDQTEFDQDLIIHINSVLSLLTQLGVGPQNGFSISDKTSTWADFLGNEAADLQAVKSYVYMKVRLIFDPPAASGVIDSYKQMINEFEWRLNVAADKSGQ